jgi:ubiquinone/menaquinone biosynthesis C-methylase UbiE
MKSWMYNEFDHCGVDYSDVRQAERYDRQHQKFRDYAHEFDAMIDFLSLRGTRELTMIDLGCGTGASSIYAAREFRKVYAVDVSEVMIQQARNKIEGQGIGNLEFINAGFLSYRHAAEQADLVMTKAAFHHLPDFWKQIALLNMNSMVKNGGILYIFDVVFNFEPQEYHKRIDPWIDAFEAQAGAEFRAEVETHIRDEFSTFNWILEGMIRRAGFEIEKSRSADGFITEYMCRKMREYSVRPG